MLQLVVLLLLLHCVLLCLQCAGVKHMNISCEACKQQGIVGTRWRCVQCPELNLCDCCYMSDKHDVNHQFVRYSSMQSGLVSRMSHFLEVLNVVNKHIKGLRLSE